MDRGNGAWRKKTWYVDEENGGWMEKIHGGKMEKMVCGKRKVVMVHGDSY